MLGNVLTSVIAGLVVFVTLLVVGVPFPFLWALWVALVDFLPMIGGALAGIPTVLFAAAHSLSAGIVTLVVFLVYTQIENHVLNPVVMSRTVRVNPLLVLLSILIGGEIGSWIGGIFGAFVGALLAIPAAGAIQVVVREIWQDTDPMAAAAGVAGEAVNAAADAADGPPSLPVSPARTPAVRLRSMDVTGLPRRATAADLPRVREVIAAAYAKYRTRMDRPPAPMLRDYTGPAEQGLVWVVGDPVVGLVSLTPEADSLLIENVAVHPDAQGTGLGRRLLEFAEQEAARRGLSQVSALHQRGDDREPGRVRPAGLPGGPPGHRRRLPPHLPGQRPTRLTTRARNLAVALPAADGQDNRGRRTAARSRSRGTAARGRAGRRRPGSGSG